MTSWRGRRAGWAEPQKDHRELTMTRGDTGSGTERRVGGRVVHSAGGLGAGSVGLQQNLAALTKKQRDAAQLQGTKRREAQGRGG